MLSENVTERAILPLLRFAGTVFVVLVTGAATYAIFLYPFDSDTFFVFWLIWIALIPFCVVAAKKLPGKVVQTLAYSLWLVCAVLAGSEVALRILARTNPSPLFARLDGSLEDRLRAFKVSGPYFHGFPISSQGWNDEEFTEKKPGVFRVASISDSFAWGGTPHYFHFSTVLERQVPNLEVANLGYPGTGLDVYLYILQYHALPLDPDLIVVNLFVGNDIVPAPTPADRGFLRRWFDRDNLMTYTVPVRIMKLARENARQEDAPRTAEIVRDGKRQVVYELQRGADGVARLTLGPNWQIAGNFTKTENDKLTQVFPWLDDPQLEPATFSGKTYLEMAARKARNICQLIEQDNAWRPVFASYVDEIAAAAGDTPVLFVILPDEFQVEDDLWERIQLGSSVRLDRDLAQRELVDLLEEQGVRYLDLLPHFNNVRKMEDGRRHLFHRRDTHLNRRGNELVARALAEWISAESDK